MDHHYKKIFYSLILGFVLMQAACGDNNIILDVDLPVNQASPFATLKVTPTASVFFLFHPLKSNPTSLDDTDLSKDIIQFPEGAAPFLQPDNESYDISQAKLADGQAYRVEMLGLLDDSPPADYKGIGDCPLIAGRASTIHICFGLNSNPLTQLCTDTVAFANCPR